jgi:hypothetical protein
MAPFFMLNSCSTLPSRLKFSQRGTLSQKADDRNGAQPRAITRDRSGRVRVDQMFIGSQSPQRAILASNISTQPVYMLDPRARTATRIAIQYAFMTVGHANDMIMPISNTCFIGFVPPQGMNRTLERNGQAKLVIEEEPARPEGDSGRSSEGNALQDDDTCWYLESSSGRSFDV